MKRLFMAAVLPCLLAGCGYGPSAGEKSAELFRGERLDQARYDLTSDNSEARRWAVIRLARAGNVSDAMAIAERLDPNRESVPLIRVTAAGAIRILGERSMIPTLTRSLRDPDATVRVESARAIGYLGGAADVPTLVHTLRNDPDPRVRVEAAYALRRMGATEALPALAAALEDRDESVVFACHYALRELTQKDLPPFKEYWLKGTARPEK